MKTLMAIAAALVLGEFGQEGLESPQPQPEHEWLRKLAGEWESESEYHLDPSEPPLKARGTESARMVGPFWAVCESRGEFEGETFIGLLNLGYDPDQKKFVGSFLDSTSTQLWSYRGTLDAAGKVLTLETELACPGKPDHRVRVRETLEIQGPDRRISRSAVEKNGDWVTTMTATYRRKK